ncbi:hypothetical protein AAC03nite_16620 [Alicyclobacillus acidoterrestris]|uniref:hypothetical protein n=1 Tax=Alicyclobacillus suci TaxID=2816080 RepID=UPI0011973B60|nr:hypothetical protein [Alicyclobacillus suci]GEO25877.1 hypothetical protein AAC03nite_16620 [Alicyclobacillus acidoterrestris]
MNYGFPDWMFAAVAIAAYEIAAWIKHRFHLEWAMWIAYAIIVICAIVLLIRYVIRMVRRRRHHEADDPDDWRNY